MSTSATDQQPSQTDIFAALQRESGRTRPTGKTRNEVGDRNGLVLDASDDPLGKPNAYDLLCPRAGCGSIILKARAGQFKTQSGVALEPASLPPNPHFQPVGDGEVDVWLVTPDAMAFENIGFSRDVGGSGTEGPPRKLLACAECDLGPLGWCRVGGSEFWLLTDRVRYRNA